MRMGLHHQKTEERILKGGAQIVKEFEKKEGAIQENTSP